MRNASLEQFVWEKPPANASAEPPPPGSSTEAVVPTDTPTRLWSGVVAGTSAMRDQPCAGSDVESE